MTTLISITFRFSVFKGLLIALICCSVPDIFGQGFYLKTGGSIGKHFQHSAKTFYEVPGLSYMPEISLLYQTGGKHEWERYFGRPRLGMNVIYSSFGNNSILGTAVGICPSIEYYLHRSERWSSTFQLGVGVAKISRYFDFNDNPLNNAIGSAWNNISKLGFHLNYTLSEKTVLNFNTHLTHFSNGGLQLPNLGLNIVGIGAGFLYQLNNTEESENIQESLFSDAISRWGMDMFAGIGLSEYGTAGGPKLPTRYFSIAGYRSLSRFLRIYLGAEYEYSEPVFQFFYHDFNDRFTASKKATNYSAYLTTELMHGPFAFRFQAGYYLPFPDIRIDKSPAYFKLHLITYTGNEKWKIRPYGGILLKTHFSIAQYIGLTGGVRI